MMPASTSSNHHTAKQN